MTIQSDVQEAQTTSDSFTQGLDGYNSLAMSELYGDVAAQGNNTHDALTTSFSSALSAWSSLVTGDASAIDAAGISFQNSDEAMAGQLAG